MGGQEDASHSTFVDALIVARTLQAVQSLVRRGKYEVARGLLDEIYETEGRRLLDTLGRLAADVRAQNGPVAPYRSGRVPPSEESEGTTDTGIEASVLFKQDGYEWYARYKSSSRAMVHSELVEQKGVQCILDLLQTLREL